MSQKFCIDLLWDEKLKTESEAKVKARSWIEWPNAKKKTKSNDALPEEWLNKTENYGEAYFEMRNLKPEWVKILSEISRSSEPKWTKTMVP